MVNRVLPDHIRLLTFDVVGTLIDFETGIVDYIQNTAGCDAEREDVLAAFGLAEDHQQTIMPNLSFTQMLEPIYERMAVELNLVSGSAEGFRRSIAQWPAFADSVGALVRLAKQFRLVALTNADNWALEHMAETLGSPFDDTVTSEDVGVNKPDPRMFTYCAERQSALGYTMAETLHVAQSQYHDIGVAMRLGYTTCWVERRRGIDGFGATPPPAEIVNPDAHVSTLAEVADLLGSD